MIDIIVSKYLTKVLITYLNSKRCVWRKNFSSTLLVLILRACELN